MRSLPLKPCLKCGHDYTLRAVEQKYCSLRCANLAMRGLRKGQAPVAATRRWQELATARSRAKISAAFGAFSDREVELIKMALSRGYQRGYQRARRDNRRDAAA